MFVLRMYGTAAKKQKKYDARHRADLQTRRRGDGERLQKCTTHATERSWKPIWRGNAENQPKSSTMHATGRTYEKPVDVAKRWKVAKRRTKHATEPTYKPVGVARVEGGTVRTFFCSIFSKLNSVIISLFRWSCRSTAALEAMHFVLSGTASSFIKADTWSKAITNDALNRTPSETK